MKILRVAAVMALAIGPAYAQMPNINLMPEVPSKTPEEKAADEVRDKAYRESLRKIPDAKGVGRSLGHGAQPRHGQDLEQDLDQDLTKTSSQAADQDRQQRQLNPARTAVR